jgi:type IV secretory pathway component VirB8
VANELRGLRYELDFPAKFRRSFRKQTGSWLGAAAAVGAVIALAPMRKKKVYVDATTRRKGEKKLMETGLAMAAMKLVGNLARPVIMEFVKNRFFYSGQPSRARK